MPSTTCTYISCRDYGGKEREKCNCKEQLVLNRITKGQRDGTFVGYQNYDIGG